MQGKTYGYIRVSAQDQSESRQLDAFKSLEIDPQNLYVEKCSGRSFQRSTYQKLIKRLKQGDLLIIKSIDRLGRNYLEIKEQWRLITQEKRADIKVIDMPLLDTAYHKDLLGTFISDLVLEILSFFSQMEWECTKKRQAEGIAAARARGVAFGREPKPLPENFKEIYNQWRSGESSSEEAAALCGFSRRTLYDKTKSMRNIK